MTKRILLAGFLATLAMFVWMSVAHMLLPLDEAGVRQIANEGPLLSRMSEAITEPGLYLFPNMVNNDQAAYYRKIGTGPSGMLIYFPRREFVFGAILGVEFLTELAQCVIAVWLLSMTRLGSFGGRLGFFAALGLLAAVSTNVSYWNWYGFPSSYTLSNMLTALIGFVCAGAVAGLMKIGGSPAAAGKREPVN